MPCYYPVHAWRGHVGKSGKRSLVFRCPRECPGEPIVQQSIPCGQCIGCRLERSRQWAMRCVDESSMHRDNSFVTLTYDKAHLPGDGFVHLRDFQLFMKRLRKKVGPVRFFHAAEYGSKVGRPHYHALLFGYRPKDLKVLRSTGSGSLLYSSDVLSGVWQNGYCSVGEVNFESAAYVARYCLKKVDCLTERFEEDGVKYDVVKSSGLIRLPEYVTMSRRPGIGKSWYDKFKSDMYPSDFRIIRDMKMKPARYYDSQFEGEDPEGFAGIKRERLGRVDDTDNTSARLLVKETCKRASLNLLSRSLEV